MLMMLAAPLFVFAAVMLPAPLSRLAGVAIVALVVGLTWRAAMVGGVDVMLLLGGAMLARRFGFPKPIAAVRAKRVAAAFMAFVAAEFGVFALIVANYTGDASYALPFDLGFLLSALAFAVLISRRQEQGSGHRTGSNFLIQSPQALFG